MPLSELLKLPAGELKSELQEILNAVVEGLCGVDAGGTVTFCNDALLNMTGFGAQELIGASVERFLHDSEPDGARSPENQLHLGAEGKCGEDIARRGISAERTVRAFRSRSGSIPLGTH